MVMKIYTDQILAFFAALVLLGDAYEKYQSIFGKKKKKQADDIENLKDENNTLKKEIVQQRKELKVVFIGVLACLRGLAEQGCDGPVEQGIKDMEKYLLDTSH
jgi:hypothetical protein